MRRNKYGVLVDELEPIENENSLDYIVECAKAVGVEVTKDTAISIPFCAEIMKRLKEVKNE